MSRAFYLNLAVDNLKKNARTIIPYILTSVLTTMMLYMVVSLANNPNLNEMLGAMTLTQMLGFGQKKTRTSRCTRQAPKF